MHYYNQVTSMNNMLILLLNSPQVVVKKIKMLSGKQGFFSCPIFFLGGGGWRCSVDHSGVNLHRACPCRLFDVLCKKLNDH